MKKIKALFYKNSNGKEPVKEWLYTLSRDDMKTVGEDIRTVEYGFPIGMPICRPLGNRLFEVRSDISNKQIARVIFTIIDSHMVLLHGFTKKTQKTLKQDIEVAKNRARELR